MSGNGYSRVTSMETSGLLANGTTSFSGPDESSIPFRRKACICALTALVVLISGAAVLVSPKAGILNNSADSVEVLVAEVHNDTPPYRMYCKIYGAHKTAQVLQTSMKEPSKQWSPQFCVKEDTTLLQRPKVELNSFGAPDAILSVNFSHPAFGENHSILGFGGAFTEAAALNYGRLTETGKQAVMELLFGASGLGYSIGRVHINSCDFSVKSYSFDETEDDFELNDFDIGVHHDVESGMVAMALRAVSVFKDAWSSDNEDAITQDGEFRLFASPWSPPSWMKIPTYEDQPGSVHAEAMTFSAEPNCIREGVGKDSRYARSWAKYFSKFLTSYSNLGLPMWAVTVQNEPEFPAPWEACAYNPAYERDFVANHLGPVLRNDHPSVKILVFDHNKDHMNTWFQYLMNDTSLAAPYIDGIAYHWYAGGMDRLLDGALGTPNMHRMREEMENYGIADSHLLLGSESCHCPTTGYAGGDIEIYWSRAERYAHTILADLAAGSNGWLEWNLILDGIGGPNHLGNLCESTILAVPHRASDAGNDIPSLPEFEKLLPFGNVSIGDGRTREELNALGFPAKFLDMGVAVQPIYYYMGHISRYVRPGSVPVLGLVQQSLGEGKIFRPVGQVVSGGGQNDLARNGIELTVWPCEGSTRQQFRWNYDSSRHIQVLGHDWLGKPTVSCIGRTVDKDFLGLRLTDCDGKEAGVFDVIPLPDHDDKRFNIILRNHPKFSNLCMNIVDLRNGGGANGPLGGAQVGLGNCSMENAKWNMDQGTGQASSSYFEEGDVCLTTGWPFLQMGAFLTPNGQSEKTIVILNEARDSANYALKDEDDVILTGVIPPRSIQTILLN